MTESLSWYPLFKGSLRAGLDGSRWYRPGWFKFSKGRIRASSISQNELFDQCLAHRGVRLVAHWLPCEVRAMRESVCGCRLWVLYGKTPRLRRQRRVL